MSGDDQAFPIPANASFGQSFGLTKRELFAAMICAGIAENSLQGELTFKDLAEDAVAQADALIAELNKP